MIKEYTYDKQHSWQGYINYVKEQLNRPLTEKEYAKLMQKYIRMVDVDSVVEEMKK